jgi:thiamine kinase-like enzyme
MTSPSRTEYYFSKLFSPIGLITEQRNKCEEVNKDEVISNPLNSTDFEIMCMFLNYLDEEHELQIYSDMTIENKNNYSGKKVQTSRIYKVGHSYFLQNFAMKHYYLPNSLESALREAYISLQMNEFIQESGSVNFVKFYGIVPSAENGNKLFYEFVENAYTLENVGLDRMNIYNICGIYFQIILALSQAQNYFGFIHNDLHSGNVLLVKTPNATLSYYIPEDDIIYKVKCDYTVRIIDYGLSKVDDDYESVYSEKENSKRNPMIDLFKIAPYFLTNERGKFRYNFDERYVLLVSLTDCFLREYGISWNQVMKVSDDQLKFVKEKVRNKPYNYYSLFLSIFSYVDFTDESIYVQKDVLEF